MSRYISQRLILLLPVLLGVSIVIFLSISLIPGDVVQVLLGAQAEASPEQLEQMRRLFGLDRPLYVQYFGWLSDALRGNLGNSLRTGRAILPDILSRFGVTAELTLVATLISLIIALPLGILSALRQDTILDFLFRILGLIGLSVPNFWLATMLILLTSLYFGWLPPLEFTPFFVAPLTNLKIIFLPALTLGAGMAAAVMRMTRSSFLEVLRQEYIQTARAKGLRERLILFRHALKNAAIPIITIIGLQIGMLLGGAVIIEEIFSLPGLGRFLLDSIYQRDYPLVQGCTLFIAFVFVLVNLFVDVLYSFLDPRIRY
ncbi:MAG: ABC transporter permease [Chloroflexi bacterium]|nr:ABC transporter permease [Chloroflexota bacterium]